MKIRFESRHGITSALIPQLLGNPLGSWTDGEEKDVPDDLVIDVRALAGGPIVKSKAVDAILVSGPDFRDAATGLNPDFTCHTCGRETLDQWYPRSDVAGNVTQTPYDDCDGNRLCGTCYLLSLPVTDAAWVYHASVGSADHREAQARIRAAAAKNDLGPSGDAAESTIAPRPTVPPAAAIAATPEHEV